MGWETTATESRLSLTARTDVYVDNALEIKLLKNADDNIEVDKLDVFVHIRNQGTSCTRTRGECDRGPSSWYL